MRRRRAHRKRSARAGDPDQSQYPDDSQYPNRQAQPQYPAEQSFIDRWQHRPDQPRYPNEQSYPGGPRYPDEQAYRAQPRYPDERSYPGGPRYPDERSYPGGPRYPDERSYPGGPRYPDERSYPGGPRYPDEQAYRAQPLYPNGQPRYPNGQPSYSDQPPRWVPPPAQDAAPARPRRRSRAIPVVITVIVLIVGLAVAGGSYLVLRTEGSPQQTAASYLSAWERGDYRAMARVSVNVPSSGLAGPLTQTSTELGVRSTHLTLGRVTTTGGTAQARFTVTDHLASSHVWTYQGLLRLVDRNRRWWVDWSPAAIYPALRAGERFALTSAWPARAPILAADGSDLTSSSAISQSGSIALLTGAVVAATAKQAKALGAPYKAGDPIGLGGIEQAYQAQLAGRPSLTVRIVGPGKHIVDVAARFAAAPGTPVRTSIELAVQLAASHAVSSANTTKPVDMVVVQPSTGRVLAVVERPGGFDRALEGIFPPGSTFKVVTASALAQTGMTPASPVQCPSQVTIDGRTFHNDANEHLGATSLQTAFAVSCNSTFALLATQRLTGTSLGSMASTYGFNATPALGIPATLGRFTRPHSPVDLAADAFGQGLDLVNPLSQATVAAAVDDGTWRPPLLVISPAPRQTARPRALSSAILSTLRPMMRAVVTSGTAAGVGFPPGVYGKTGTAEFGTGPHPQSHGWFIGYRGDLAFAVLVEGGGFGANSAGPIANAFLRGY